ncbi:hypothetical protein [Methanofollis fontis]|uniref:CARDB domain-containing protein n=1 Tax=Methanofollis fontis TaxID=2052832 RepID=A0A483CP20_9EURY|nr:hypothetical protein [Methanofollis fontis]TAJ44455.1 hypothetical protein CUJ86_03800 [Methanofollis fontis]
MRIIHLLIALLAAALLCAGCTSESPPPTPAPGEMVTPAPTPGAAAAISVETLSLTPRYSPDGSFSMVARIRAENTGTLDVTGVVITVELVDTASNTISDSKNQYIERFIPGDSKIYDITLAAEAGRTYEVHSRVVSDQS